MPVLRSRIPNLFMVGFPKAGSTSLARWMAAHPRIGLGVAKETKFLYDEDHPRRIRTSYCELGLPGYAQAFRNIPEDHSFAYLLDADVQNFSQRTALEVITSLSDAHVIFLLREPVSRLMSAYNFMKNNEGALPKDMSFTDCIMQWREDWNARMRNAFGVQSRSEFPELCYVEYITIWQNALGQDRITYVFFEDLVKSPQETITRLMQELGLQHDVYDDFAFGNERPTNTVVNHRLHRMLLSFKQRNREFFERLRPLKPLYEHLNYRSRKPAISEQDRETIAWMNDFVRPWNQELRRLIGVDELPWKEYGPPRPTHESAVSRQGMR